MAGRNLLPLSHGYLETSRGHPLCAASGGAGAFRSDRGRALPGMRPAPGEWPVRGHLPAETRFYLRTACAPSAVPWLDVSGAGQPETEHETSHS